MQHNRYLMDKAMRDMAYRNGGYDSRRDMRQYPPQQDYRRGMDQRDDYHHIPMYPTGTTVEGYGYGNFYPMDSRRGDYTYSPDYNEKEQEYEKDLKEWVEKLKRKIKMPVSFDQVIETAHSHGVKFKEFTELEFYAITLAMFTDYPSAATDLKSAVVMAKDFFEDDDIKVSPSEKICIYFYKIVKGE